MAGSRLHRVRISQLTFHALPPAYDLPLTLHNADKLILVYRTTSFWDQKQPEPGEQPIEQQQLNADLKAAKPMSGIPADDIAKYRRHKGNGSNSIAVRQLPPGKYAKGKQPKQWSIGIPRKIQYNVYDAIVVDNMKNDNAYQEDKCKGEMNR